MTKAFDPDSGRVFESREEMLAWRAGAEQRALDEAAVRLSALRGRMLDEAFSYMYDYFKATDKAPNLGKFGQRYGKRVKQLGPDMTILALLQSDPRFKVGLNPNNGAYMIMPADFDALEHFLKTGERST